jgi:hypothetical protein
VSVVSTCLDLPQSALDFGSDVQPAKHQAMKSNAEIPRQRAAETAGAVVDQEFAPGVFAGS